MDVFVVENQDVLEHLHSLAASIVWIIKEHMIRVLLNRLTSIALAYILARTDDTPRDSIKPNTKHIVELSVKQKYPRRLITIYSCVPFCIFTWVLSLLGRFCCCCLKKTAIFTILWRYVHSDWQIINSFLYVIGMSNSMWTWTYMFVFVILGKHNFKLFTIYTLHKYLPTRELTHFRFQKYGIWPGSRCAFTLVVSKGN